MPEDESKECRNVILALRCQSFAVKNKKLFLVESYYDKNTPSSCWSASDISLPKDRRDCVLLEFSVLSHFQGFKLPQFLKA